MSPEELQLGSSSLFNQCVGYKFKIFIKDFVIHFVLCYDLLGAVTHAKIPMKRTFKIRHHIIFANLQYQFSMYLSKNRSQILFPIGNQSRLLLLSNQWNLFSSQRICVHQKRKNWCPKVFINVETNNHHHEIIRSLSYFYILHNHILEKKVWVKCNIHDTNTSTRYVNTMGMHTSWMGSIYTWWYWAHIYIGTDIMLFGFILRLWPRVQRNLGFEIKYIYQNRNGHRFCYNCSK